MVSLLVVRTTGGAMPLAFATPFYIAGLGLDFLERHFSDTGLALNRHVYYGELNRAACCQYFLSLSNKCLTIQRECPAKHTPSMAVCESILPVTRAENAKHADPGYSRALKCLT